MQPKHISRSSLRTAPIHRASRAASRFPPILPPRPHLRRSARAKAPLKAIIITGGVISGLGKGVAAASIGRLFAGPSRIVPLKCDGYLNVDPGTMNPVEHGEVFVLDDGTEVDMDFGHYERFLGIACKGAWNLTMGKVFDAIRIKERKGDYLGKTVQFIPHVTDLIQGWWLAIAKAEEADVLLIEVGGTVGDMENELYIEAARQFKKTLGPENVLYMHLTYVPNPGGVHELKSKPTQQSVMMLREKGIFPDVLVARAEHELTDAVKDKIALFCDIPREAIVSNIDTCNIYSLPLSFDSQGVGAVIERRLGIPRAHDLRRWEEAASRLSELHPGKGEQGGKQGGKPGDKAGPSARQGLTIALCGKYTRLEDSYASIGEALRHVSSHLDVPIDVKLVETTGIKSLADAARALQGIDAVIVPGGFGSRGVEGKILIIRRCREEGIPFLGLCLGLQLAVVEFARDVCGLTRADSTEMDAKAKDPVIDIMPEQRGVTDKGASMRLGAYPAMMRRGTEAFELYGEQPVVFERHRHRYEVNPEYHALLQEHGLVFSGMSPNGRLVEFIELPKQAHPYFVATQAHPELKSGLLRPAPLFLGLAEAAIGNRRKHLARASRPR